MIVAVERSGQQRLTTIHRHSLPIKRRNVLVEQIPQKRYCRHSIIFVYQKRAVTVRHPEWCRVSPYLLSPIPPKRSRSGLNGRERQSRPRFLEARLPFPSLCVAFLPPDLPIIANGIQHLNGCPMQPFAFLLSQVSKDGFARRTRSQMNVGGLPSHGMQKSKFFALSFQRG